MGVGAGLYMYDVVVKTFTFAISSPHEFLYHIYDVYLLPGGIGCTCAQFPILFLIVKNKTAKN